MVGHVQSRKAKLVVPLFDVVQSVDSLRLAQRLSRFAGDCGRKLAVLLEINVSGEASKYGLEGYNWCQDNAVKERLWSEINEIAALPHVDVKGLMTMAPYDADKDLIRRVFVELSTLRHELAHSLDLRLPELSMGMTNDYEIAIEEARR